MNRPLIRLAEGYSKQKNANLLPKKLSTQMFCLLWRRNKGARWRKVLDFFDFGTFSRKYKKKNIRTITPYQAPVSNVFQEIEVSKEWQLICYRRNQRSMYIEGECSK
jgi:hypothetical protein